MRSELIFPSIAIVVVVVIIGWVVVTQGGGFADNSTKTPNGRDDVYGLVFTDYSGQEIELGDFSADVLVVNTWATWCPFCVDELPAFAELQSEFSENVAVIAINRGERLEQAKGYTDELGISNELFFLQDEGDDFYDAVDAFTMPETLIIDNTTGEILQHKRGPMELSEMRSRVERALEEIPPEQPVEESQ